MPLYDYHCSSCDIDMEIASTMAARKEQDCPTCGTRLEQVLRPQRAYVPFNSYFDVQLGVEITGRDHRRRVMRDMKVDFRDHPSQGNLSARADRCNEIRKNRART